MRASWREVGARRKGADGRVAVLFRTLVKEVVVKVRWCLMRETAKVAKKVDVHLLLQGNSSVIGECLTNARPQVSCWVVQFGTVGVGNASRKCGLFGDL